MLATARARTSPKSQVLTDFLRARFAGRPYWECRLLRLKQQVGACDTSAPITATGALAGKFTWRCATGRIEGTLLARADHTGDHPAPEAGGGEALSRAAPAIGQKRTLPHC